MKKIYNAGPLFSESERKQRLYEDEQLQQLNMSESVEVFNPISAPITVKGTRKNSVTHKEVFDKDYEFIKEANVFIFDLSNDDSGTLVELGIALQLKMDKPHIEIYPIISDFRYWTKVKGNDTHKDSMFGVNKFVMGALDSLGITIYETFDDVLETIKNKQFTKQ